MDKLSPEEIKRLLESPPGQLTAEQIDQLIKYPPKDSLPPELLRELAEILGLELPE